MPFVLDNSVVIAWFFEDEDAPYADGVLRILEATVPWYQPSGRSR